MQDQIDSEHAQDELASPLSLDDPTASPSAAGSAGGRQDMLYGAPGAAQLDRYEGGE